MHYQKHPPNSQQKVNPKIMEETGVKQLKNGESGLVQIIPMKEMTVESFADYPKLGRFFLSDNN